MRTLWHLAATLFALGSGCISGEYTTSPDLALPVMTTPDMNNPDILMPDMTSLPDMTNLYCGQKLIIGTGPLAGCPCTIQCQNPLSCTLNSTSSMEVCDDKDNNCNGSIDDGASPDTTRPYISQALPYSKSWDNNCNGIIEFGVQIPSDTAPYRNLSTTQTSTCAQADYNSACAKVGMMACLTSAAICLSAATCGAPDPVVYKCMTSGTTCVASTAASNPPQILCK